MTMMMMMMGLRSLDGDDLHDDRFEIT